MKLRIPVLSLLAAVIAGPAFATEARDAGMNADHWKIKDSTNAEVLPAEIMGYKKVVYGELGTTTGSGDDYAGAHLPVGPGLLAIYAGAIPTVPACTLIGRSDDATASTINVPTFNASGAGMLASTAPLARLRLLYGLSLGGDLDVAAGFDYFSRMTNDDSFSDGIGTTTYADSSSAINIRAGVSVPLGPIDPLSVGFFLGMPSFEVAQKTANGKVDSFASTGGTDIGINARARLSGIVGQNSASYIYVSFGSGSIDAASKSQNLEQDTKEIKAGHVTVGLANNHRVGEGSILAWTLAYQTTSQGLSVADTIAPVTTGSQETADSALPITVAFETKLLKWLTVRVSSWSAIAKSRTVTTKVTGGQPGPKPTDETKTDLTSIQDFALGATIAVSDKISIDGVLREALVFNGPYFASGFASGLFGQVSLEYRF